MSVAWKIPSTMPCIKTQVFFPFTPIWANHSIPFIFSKLIVVPRLVHGNQELRGMATKKDLLLLSCHACWTHYWVTWPFWLNLTRMQLRHQMPFLKPQCNLSSMILTSFTPWILSDFANHISLIQLLGCIHVHTCILSVVTSVYDRNCSV